MLMKLKYENTIAPKELWAQEHIVVAFSHTVEEQWFAVYLLLRM